MMYNAFKH